MARLKIEDGVKTTLIIRKDMHNSMQKYCIKNEISMASFMRMAIYLSVDSMIKRRIKK